MQYSTGEPHNPFPNYRYTGDLQAVYPLSPMRQVPKEIMRRKYIYIKKVQ